MKTETAGTVVRLEMVVEAGVERAFAVFTERFDAVKPRDHNWDIGPQWQIEADPARTSEVEVRFVAEGEGRTRVELEHRNLDRHGAGWEAERDAVGGPGGWPVYLERYGTLMGG